MKCKYAKKNVTIEGVKAKTAEVYDLAFLKNITPKLPFFGIQKEKVTALYFILLDCASFMS